MGIQNLGLRKAAMCRTFALIGRSSNFCTPTIFVVNKSGQDNRDKQGAVFFFAMAVDNLVFHYTAFYMVCSTLIGSF